MMQETIAPLTLRAEVEQWPLVAPFRIFNHTWEKLDVLVVHLQKGAYTGRAEAAGVYYKNDTPASMLPQIESVRGAIEAGLSLERIQKLLPPGGARNALDCAFWDLLANISGRRAWEIASLEKPHPIITTFTCGADEPEKMATVALGYTHARAIKLKLIGDELDAERVRAVRRVKPQCWIGVDANQGFTRQSLERLLPVLVENDVQLIEQPFPVGQEAQLDGLRSPIPVAADETVQSLADMSQLAGRFNVVNIKLDKCGGLTEGLAMARAAHALGVQTMVGNMIGTSLGMAPSFLVGQLCSVVDLDGPIFLKSDRDTTVRYADGMIDCPESNWG